MAGCNAGIFGIATILMVFSPGCTSSNQPPHAATTGPGECAWPPSLDAVAAAPGNHRVLLENERVRVLEVVVAPGEREPVHAHCRPAAAYTMSGGKYRDFDAQGNLQEQGEDSQLPTASWVDPVAPHSYENLDTTPFRMVLVELKQ